MAGSKPEILGFVITSPLHQVLRFSTNDMMLPDCLDFVVFFTANFEWWCFVVQYIGLVESEEVSVKNVVKST